MCLVSWRYAATSWSNYYTTTAKKMAEKANFLYNVGKTTYFHNFEMNLLHAHHHSRISDDTQISLKYASGRFTQYFPAKIQYS